MSEKLWRFDWDCGRNGDIEGIFIATDEEIKGAIGKNVYLGEVLGKHSEVQGLLEEGDITLITDDQTAVSVIREHLHGGIGFNPFDYIQCEHGYGPDDGCSECPEDA